MLEPHIENDGLVVNLMVLYQLLYIFPAMQLHHNRVVATVV